MKKSLPPFFRSFASDDRLILDRDFEGLWVKNRCRLPYSSRPRMVWDGFLGAVLLSQYNPLYPNDRVFGPIYLSSYETSAIAGHDGGYRLGMCDADVNVIHVGAFSGAQQLRAGLAEAAVHIKSYDGLRGRSTVLGVTYPEMAALAIRSGFRALCIDEIYPVVEYDVEASHRTYCEINGLDRPFEVRAVYLPTEEFISTFYDAGALSESMSA